MNKIKNPDALIRIGDVIEVLCHKNCYPGALCPDGYCVEMWDKFKNVEPVDVVPVRHGRWEKCLGKGLSCKCSVCASKYDIPWRYCPNCGTRMDWKDSDNEKTD